MKKKIIYSTLILAGIVAGACFLKAKKSDPADSNTDKTTTVVVKRGPIRLSVSTTGRVTSNLDVEIKCKASGQVVTLPFDVSDPVKKGDLLVALDPIDEQRKFDQAQVAVLSSQARLEQARLNLQNAEKNLVIERQRTDATMKSAEARAEDARSKEARMKQLLEKKRVSQEEFETAHTTAVEAASEAQTARTKLDDLKVQEKSLELRRQDVTLAEADLKSDRINLEIAQQRLTETKVFAPIDGVVSERTVQIGQIVSSPLSNVGGGTALLTLSDLSRIFILASVDESDIGKITVGQDARVTADAFKGVKFEGKVERIATQGVNTSNVVTFEVKIEVLSENKTLLKPEMTATVEVVSAEKDNVVLVPSNAIVRKNGGTLVRLPSPEGKEPEERAVKVGISNLDSAEILSGLQEGETVLVQKAELESRWSQAQGQGRTGAGRPPMMMPMGGGGRH